MGKDDHDPGCDSCACGYWGSPKPITEKEIRYALFEGAYESQAAQGNHAWSSLLAQRDAAVEQLAKLQLSGAERDALIKLVEYMRCDASSEGSGYPMKEWEKVALRALGRIIG